MKSLADWLISLSTRRAPDVIIGGADAPYLRRWWLIPRNRFFNVYLHQFLRSDDDRALHDHPWWNMSWLLRGEYVEVVPHRSDERVEKHLIRQAGDMKVRAAGARHRIVLHRGECWTLFITGPRIREWGFWCPKGWVHWKDFTDVTGKSVGRGCGE